MANSVLERGGGEADTLLGGGEESQAAGKGDLSHMPRISIRRTQYSVWVFSPRQGVTCPHCASLCCLEGGGHHSFLHSGLVLPGAAHGSVICFQDRFVCFLFPTPFRRGEECCLALMSQQTAKWGDFNSIQHRLQMGVRRSDCFPSVP